MIFRMILRRIAISIPLVFIVSMFTFVLVALIPGNIARYLLGPTATQDQIVTLSKQMGLNRPVLVQYWEWWTKALHGDLGSSLTTGQSVTTTLAHPLVVSLNLITLSVLLTAVVGISFGVIAAVRGGWIGRVVDIAATIGLAIPSFWIGLELIELFAVKWRLLPATGFVPFSQSPLEWARSLLLPVLSIAVGGITVIAVQTRDSMLDTLGRSFIRVLQANGFSRRSIIYRHALRNAALPVVTVLAIIFVVLLGASVFAEQIFSLPGMGSALISSVSEHNFPVIQGIVLYFTLIVVAVNLLTDIAYGLLNPRPEGLR
jgi:peptide/nickel transport system permease protein